jgi:hypothetical protein
VPKDEAKMTLRSSLVMPPLRGGLPVDAVSIVAMGVLRRAYC